jgi:hypothetical protein
VHVIQLAVNKFINSTPGVKKIIALAQSVAVKLRTPTYRNLLRLSNQKQAILMHAVRWSWTYKLLCRLIELRAFCKDCESDCPTLKIFDTQWNMIIELCKVLAPVATLTSQLQAQGLNIPDFVFLYKKAETKLQLLGTNLSKSLMSHLNLRKPQMFDTDLMNAATFLDKRFAISLSDRQLEDAKKFIALVSRKFNKNLDSSAVNDELPGESSQDCDIAYMNEMMNHIESVKSIDMTSVEPSLDSEIRRYTNIPRLPITESSSSDVFKFWNEHSSDFPKLAQIALAIFSIPLTEVDVERLFSNLKFILDNHRTALTDEILNAIMLIRMNKKFE